MAAQPGDGSDLVDVLLEVSRTFTAIVASSMIRTDATLTTPQLRVLMVLEGLGSTNLSGLAADLGVDASTASRACEQLVRRRLVSRVRDPADRRHVDLRLSAKGRALVERLLVRRRELLAEMVQRLSDEDRAQVARGLEVFGETARSTLATARQEGEAR